MPTLLENKVFYTSHKVEDLINNVYQVWGERYERGDVERSVIEASTQKYAKSL